MSTRKKTSSTIIFLCVICFCSPAVHAGGLPKEQRIVFSAVRDVPGYASLYRQRIDLPFFNPSESVTFLVESVNPPQPEQRTQYLQITHGDEVIYSYSRSNEEQAEFLGVCRDPKSRLAQVVLAEYASHGGISNYVFIYYNTGERSIERHTVETTVALSALVGFGKEENSIIDDGEPENPFLTRSSENVPVCQWEAVSTLHNQIQQDLDGIVHQTTAVTFPGKTHFTSDAHLIDSLILPQGKHDLLKSIPRAIKNGDNRYTIELMDGDETQEIVAISFYEPIGRELSGESSGVILRVDKKSQRLQSLFRMEERPYPYGGLCSPLIWIGDPTTLYGWLTEGAQPCRFYPVEIDLKTMTYRFLSNTFQYDTEYFEYKNNTIDFNKTTF